MTSMFTDLVEGRLPGTPSGALALPVDAIVTAFLVAFLVGRLLVQARGTRGTRWRVHPVDVAVVPLIFAFGAIAVGRILEIMPLG